MFNFFKTRPDLPLSDGSKEEMQARFKRYQWHVFLGLVFGYAVFYVVRMSLGVVKKPMLDAGIVTIEELGIMGSAFFFTYAFGKFSNGFLSDYANIGRFMSFSTTVWYHRSIHGFEHHGILLCSALGFKRLVPICWFSTVLCVSVPMVLTKTTW